MNQTLNVLIIDEQPLIIEAYRLAFSQVTSQTKKIKFNISTAHNCDSAEAKITEAVNGTAYDMVLLDVDLPASKSESLLSGDGVGIKIRKHSKNVKLIVITSHHDNFKLCHIFKTLNPDGFMVKPDISLEELVKAITCVISNTPYYSKTVTQLIRRRMANQIIIDKRDWQILYHLSLGTRTKDISNIVHLSIAGIEKRKRHLRNIFNTNNEDDKILIERAKEKGFV